MANRTFPIILAHGIARFDILARTVLDDENQLDDSTHYFRGIRSTLRTKGFTVTHSSVGWADPVDQRAAELKTSVEKVLADEKCEKVHIIAHSMGGLDARHMLFNNHKQDRMHEKVASLSTISTPHLGTSFADWGLAHAEPFRAMLDRLKIKKLDGFRDLTTKACTSFNVASEDFEKNCGVLFHTYAGIQDLPFIFQPLQLSWMLIQATEGTNDGLVSLASASWRKEYFQREINADHLNEIGWWEPNDQGVFAGLTRGENRQEMEQRIRAFYIQIAEGLAQKFALGP